MSYFKSLLAEILPGWTLWRSSPRPTQPLDGAPLGKGVEPADADRAIKRTSPDPIPAPPAAGDQPPADPDSLNRKL